ncbi:MAG TPA: lipopolysaccharide kinase InaA family protein [Candidatus Binatia bacterium]|jgi:hypothetical protein
MIFQDRLCGIIPCGFRKVVDDDTNVMIVREDVVDFLTIERCTKRRAEDADQATAFAGRARLRAIQLQNGERALIRPYRHGGLFRHLLGGVFFTWPPRPFRELVVTEEVRHRGIPTVEVLAACVKSIGGPFYHGWLVSRQLDGSEDLWTAISDGLVRETGAEKILDAVAVTLRALHREGIYHRDLNLKNILVRRESDSVRGYVIDFDRALLFLGEVPPVMVQRNFDRLLRSALKLDPKRQHLSPGDWEHLVDSYHRRKSHEP